MKSSLSLAHRSADHLRAAAAHQAGHPALHRGGEGGAVDAADPGAAPLDLRRPRRRLLHVGARSPHGRVGGSPGDGLHHGIRLLQERCLK